MSIKKSLLLFAAMALAMTAFASSAMAAGEGVLRDVGTGEAIQPGEELHFVGAAKFEGAGSSFECHVTSVVEATTASTGDVTEFTVPDTTKCVGVGVFAGCELTKHESTNLPWGVTTTLTDFDVAGNIEIDNQFAKCPEVPGLGHVESVVLKFGAITLLPLGTGAEEATGTENNLGGIAKPGDPIAGGELEGEGEAVVTFSGAGPVPLPAVASGKLELTEPGRCTWELSS